MLVELRVAEQRLRAVWEVLDGASVIEAARRLRVPRQSLHSGCEGTPPIRGWVIGRRGRLSVLIRCVPVTTNRATRRVDSAAVRRHPARHVLRQPSFS